MKITLSESWEGETLVNGREHQKYYLKNGDLVPGVTTILNCLGKQELIHWAWKLGMDGTDYRTVRDSAGNVGTIAHFICQCYVNEKNPVFKGFDEEAVDKAYASFGKFRTFWEDNDYKLVACEIQLVSEEKKYGGTLDLVVLDENDKMLLIDLKTSKSVYPSHISQLAAYRFLWDCNHRNFIDECKIVRLGKESVDDFEVHDVKDNLCEAHEARFIGALSVYNADRRIDAFKTRKNKTK